MKHTPLALFTHSAQAALHCQERQHMFALQPGDTGCIANPLACGAGPQNRLLCCQEDEKSAPPPLRIHMPFYLAHTLPSL